MTRILLTGSTGFLGEHLTRALLQREDLELFTLDRSVPVRPYAGVTDALVVPGTESIGGFSEKIREWRPEVFVHCAAMSSHPGCESEPESAKRVNVQYTQNLAELAATLQAHFCYLSTDFVYDGNANVPEGGFRETDTPRPRSVYAQTKHLAEQIVTDLLPERSVILRSSLLIGAPAGRNGGPTSWIFQAVKERRPITAFVDEWRTPLYVGDLQRVVEQCILRRPVGVYHVSGPERLSRLECMREVLIALGAKDYPLEEVSRTSIAGPERPADLSLNNRKLSAEFSMNFRSMKEVLPEAFH